MQVLGYGYLSRRKSFKGLNHAMQLLYMSQIAKIDFNTDVLRLRRKSPSDFNSLYLEIFKLKVLFPLFQRLFRQLHRYPSWLKEQLKSLNLNLKSEFIEFDRYDLRNAFDLVIGASHQVYPNELEKILESYIHGMDSESLKALKFFNFEERVFHWLWPYLKVTTFDEALQLYFSLNSRLGKISLEIYGLDRLPTRPLATKLPAQAKLFRE